MVYLAVLSNNYKSMNLSKMGSAVRNRSSNLIQWLISYVTHLFPRGYFHTKNEMIAVTIVEVTEQTLKKKQKKLNSKLPRSQNFALAFMTF